MRLWQRLQAGSYACFIVFGSCPPPMQPLGLQLQKMGLVEMRSPREVWPIGTIVAIKRDQYQNIIEVPDVCNPILIAPSLVKQGTSFMKEKTSEASQLERASVGGSFSLNGVSVGDVKAGLGAKGERLSGINVSISNAWILYADDVTLSRTAAALLKDPDCSAQVRHRQQAGYTVTVLDRVLVADMTYTINTSGSLSGEEKAELTKQVGEELRASYDQAHQTLVKGGGLTFGFSVASVSPVPLLGN